MSDLATPGADAFLAGTALPATLHVQLHTGNPGTNGTANVAAETDRIAINPFGAPTTGGAGFRQISNTAIEELLNASTTENITHVSYWSAASAGTCWFVDALAGTLAVEAGNTVSIAPGASIIRVPVWT